MNDDGGGGDIERFPARNGRKATATTSVAVRLGRNAGMPSTSGIVAFAPQRPPSAQ